MPNVGPMELVVVLVIALLVLGPKRLPEVGRSVGRGIREFKNSIGGKDDDEHFAEHTEHPAVSELSEVRVVTEDASARPSKDPASRVSS